jgi:6-phosphogluconolactonase
MNHFGHCCLTIAVAVVAIQSEFSDPAAAQTSGKYWVYVGAYTSADGSKGIYRSELDLKSGKLSEPCLVAELANPSFLAISPNGKYLYAVAETSDNGARKNEGALYAYQIDTPSGALMKLNHLTTGGGGPCYVSVNRTGKFAFVANYGGGSSALFHLHDDGSLDKQTDFRQHEGKSVNKDRQQEPHAHCAMFNGDSQNEHAYVVDLGLDKVFSYRLDPVRGRLTSTDPPFVSLPSGCGPRHIAFNPKTATAYVCGELDSSLITLKQNGESGVLRMADTLGAVLSTLPNSIAKDVRAKNSTAEVLVHPAGKHVLVSNRGHDSLAVFAVTAGTTTAVGHITSAGERQIRTPRNFNIDPTGRWILIANQTGGTVEVAEWTGTGGKLTGQSVKVDKPVCVKFLARP